MKPMNADSARTLLLWSAPIVVGHFVAVQWHLMLVVEVQPDLPRFAPPLLILVNLVPVAGLVVFAKGLPKLAGSMITLPLSLLVIGVYAHFLSRGTDNIFRMPPGDLRLAFQISAVLLVLLEALGCCAGLRIFRQTSVRRALKT
jgi:hypothetical protein